MSFFIVAVDEKWGIAKNHKIPWHYPEDFAWFKEKTKGKDIIMGYNTYKEIAEMRGYPEKTDKILPGRIVYVITTKNIPESNYVIKKPFGFEINYSSMFCYAGGAKIYEHAMGETQHMANHYGLITRIKHDYNCDTFFNNELLEKHYYLDQIVSETDDLRFELWVSNNEKNWKEKGYKFI